MVRRSAIALLAVVALCTAIGPATAAGHWSLAFWRSLNSEEASNNLYVRIWTFDENGNVVGNVPITTDTGVLVATTGSDGRVDFPLDVNNEYVLKVNQGGVSSDLTPYMSNGRFPNWGHYSYELGFMYKSNINNPGTFDTSIVGGDVPRKGGTSNNAPVTASMAYHSFNPWDWDSDIGCRVLPESGWGEHGQTFIPNGNRVACVQFHPTVGGNNNLIQFTVEIRQGGPTGPVIASRTSSPHYNQDWWVVPFGTSACPVVAGQTYFARVYRSGGFNAYYMNTSFYPNGLANGQAYWRANDTSAWGLAPNPDLKGFIVCCNAQSTVSVANVNAAAGTGSATITWTTDVPSTSRVDYGTDGSYGKFVSDSALVTSHSVTVPKLHADTLYHYKVTSSASGLNDGTSADLTFLTSTASANLLVNGGFESGMLSPWVVFGSFSNPSSNSPLGKWCVAKCPCEGQWDAVSVTSYGTKNGGLYQRVSGLTPGVTYTLRAFYYTTQTGGADSDLADQLGIDPYGGTNPASVTVIKTPEMSSQDTWATALLSAQAQSSTITVFLAAIQKWALAWNINGFDDVRLTGPAAGNIPTVKGFVDGAQAVIQDKVVTATSGQIGAYYIQEPDRQNGLRVEAISGSANVGDRVSVSGWLATVGGERMIVDATINVIGSASAKPLAMINKVVGGKDFNDKAKGATGAVGVNTVGLLVKTFGEVTSVGTADFYVSDRSGASIRVKAPAGITLPQQGDFVAVTGICRLMMNGADYVPYLECRQNSDYQRIQ